MEKINNNALRICQFGMFSLIPVIIVLITADVNPINQYRLLKYGITTTGTVTEMVDLKKNDNPSSIPTTYKYNFQTRNNKKYLDDILVWIGVPDVSKDAVAPFKAKVTYLPNNPAISSFAYRVPTSILDLVFPIACYYFIPFVLLYFLWPKKEETSDLEAIAIPMNKEIALLISLITHGNEFFKSGKLRKGYFPESPVFKGLEGLRFIGLGVGDIATASRWEIARDPKSWFELLKKDGCERLSMSFEIDQPEEYNIWHIEAEYPFFSDIYMIEDLKKPEVVRVQSRVVKPKVDYDLEKYFEIFKIAIAENAIYTANFPVLEKYGDTFNMAYNILMDNVLIPDNPSIIASSKEYSTKALQIINSALILDIYTNHTLWDSDAFQEYTEARAFAVANNLLLDGVEKALAAAVNSATILNPK